MRICIHQTQSNRNGKSVYRNRWSLRLRSVSIQVERNERNGVFWGRRTFLTPIFNISTTHTQHQIPKPINNARKKNFQKIQVIKVVLKHINQSFSEFVHLILLFILRRKRFNCIEKREEKKKSHDCCWYCCCNIECDLKVSEWVSMCCMCACMSVHHESTE